MFKLYIAVFLTLLPGCLTNYQDLQDQCKTACEIMETHQCIGDNEKKACDTRCSQTTSEEIEKFDDCLVDNCSDNKCFKGFYPEEVERDEVTQCKHKCDKELSMCSDRSGRKDGCQEACVKADAKQIQKFVECEENRTCSKYCVEEIDTLNRREQCKTKCTDNKTCFDQGNNGDEATCKKLCDTKSRLDVERLLDCDYNECTNWTVHCWNGFSR